MLIHILPEVRGEVLTPALESHVIESGHTLTRNLEEASVAIGIQSSNWSRVKDPTAKVVLKDTLSNVEVPTSSTMFNIFTLTLIDRRPVTLSDWLRDLSDPLNV